MTESWIIVYCSATFTMLVGLSIMIRGVSREVKRLHDKMDELQQNDASLLIKGREAWASVDRGRQAAPKGHL